MTRCVLIACIERRNESSGEREAGPAKSIVCRRQPLGRLFLLPVKVEKSLSSQRRNEEHEHKFQRVGVVRPDEERQDGDIEGHRDPVERGERLEMWDRIDAAHESGGGSEETVCGEEDH